MTFGLTRGEIILIAAIFALVYGAGLLPKLTAWITRGAKAPDKRNKSEGE